MASVIVIWRFTGTRLASATSERRAQQLVAVSFFLLAPYIAVEAVRTLVSGDRADLRLRQPASRRLSRPGLLECRLSKEPALGVTCAGRRPSVALSLTAGHLVLPVGRFLPATESGTEMIMTAARKMSAAAEDTAAQRIPATAVAATLAAACVVASIPGEEPRRLRGNALPLPGRAGSRCRHMALMVPARVLGSRGLS
jgi:hypothetical protein